MLRPTLPPLAILLLAILAAANCAPPRETAVPRGRALTDWSSPKSVEALTEAASPGLRDLIAESGGPADFSKSVADQLGPELEVFDEQALTLNGVTTYLRLARHGRVPAALTSAMWDDEGLVLAAGVTPAPPLRAAEAAPAKTPLALPFAAPKQGAWFTYWGGRNAVRNHHVSSPQQLYAYDLLVARNGRTFEGPREANSSYFCWGEPILAAAAGRVVRVVDGVADNSPGMTNNPAQPAGNHVIIEHRPGEFSLSGHLRRGSPTVNKGQEVSAGQRIGDCGNSGNSSEPHLHFHMQTAGAFGEGRGIPAPFDAYLADGKPMKGAQPVRGQTLARVHESE